MFEETLDGITHNATEYEIYEGKSYATYRVGSRFRIIDKDDTKSYPAIKTEIDAPSISLYRLVGGCNDYGYKSFLKPGREATEDAIEIMTNKKSSILNLPSDYTQATKILLTQYKGKVLRIFARSALGTAKFGDRMYLFVVED